MQKTQEIKPYFQVLSAEKIKEIINDENYLIIDIRDKFELKDLWTISDRKDLLNINFYWADFRKNLDKLDKNQKYIIYCNRWNRTQFAFQVMKELWFKHVVDLEWWIQNWIWKNYETYAYFK